MTIRTAKGGCPAFHGGAALSCSQHDRAVLFGRLQRRSSAGAEAPAPTALHESRKPAGAGSAGVLPDGPIMACRKRGRR